ncbi:MAG: PAS domain S-box-containing protein [Cognaticolwellia sp.]
MLIANDQLCFQNEEKDKWVAELVIASECRIAATVFESQEGMFFTDANSSILRVNRAFTRITGYSAEEAIGQTPRLISSGKQSKAFFDTMWQSINSIGGWADEIWNKRKNGEVYPEYLTITAVKLSFRTNSM